MHENQFELGVYNRKSVKKTVEIIYCPTHKIEFCEIEYPPDDNGETKLNSAKSVAADHMCHYGCKVYLITPRF